MSLRSDRTDLRDLRRKTRLNEYQFAISIRRLQSLGLLTSSTVEDEYENRYSLVQPTTAGIDWAADHNDDMVAAIAEVAPKTANDDDIPF